MQVKQNGQSRTVDITIRPLAESGEASSLLLVVFEEVLPPEPTQRRKRKPLAGEETHPRVVELEGELQVTRENLQTTIEELEAANEELKSSNEELQSTNEEMQSTNEELVTINSELQNKVVELTQVNDDINNLFAGTDIGTIFLDNHLCIKRFTPAMKKVFNLIPSDIGRSLRDIPSKIAFESIFDDAESVIETLQTREKEVETEEGKWFSMRILPYRTRDNQIDGVVVTFVDITALKWIERELNKARAYAENMVDTVREPLLTLDAGLRVVSANRSFYRFFRTLPEETVGKLIYDLGNGQWDIPELKRLLEEIIPENTSFEDFVVEHQFPSIGFKKMVLNARRVEQQGSEPALTISSPTMTAGATGSSSSKYSSHWYSAMGLDVTSISISLYFSPNLGIICMKFFQGLPLGSFKKNRTLSICSSPFFSFRLF